MTCAKSPSSTQLLRIGELAEQTGTTLRTLHYYEELGLIEPTERTKGGFRLYAPEQLERLRWVQRLRELGLELCQIKEFFAAQAQEEGDAAVQMRGVVEKELRWAQSLVYRYSRLRDELHATLDILHECEQRNCPRTPGGSHCPQCEVIRDREAVPTIFQPDTSRD